MKQHNIFITEEDMERLQYLLDPAGRLLSRDQEHLETLEEELDRAKIVSPSQVPDGRGHDELKGSRERHGLR